MITFRSRSNYFSFEENNFVFRMHRVTISDPLSERKRKKKKIGKLVLARNEGCKEAWRQGKTTRKEEERKRGREEASFRGQFVHNVNCRNYYDIIIHPNCTSNRHAKCLIASSGGGRGAEDGIGGQRVETMRGEAGEKGTCN